MNESEFREIARDFELGAYVAHEEIRDGNAETYRLITSNGAFFLKRNVNVETLALYRVVEQQADHAGVRQAQIFRKPDGGLISSSGFAVYEFLEGDASGEMNERRLASLMIYLSRFQEVLKEIEVPKQVIDLNNNPWQKANSLTYLLKNFGCDISGLEVSDFTRAIARKALRFLETKRDDLEDLPKQIIHGDIGSGNILYREDSVVSIIDFTPMCGTELYGLCHFFYWQFLSNGQIDYGGIQKALELYVECASVVDTELALFHPLFVKAAAFRLFGAMLCLKGSPGSYSAVQLDKRATLLRLVLNDDMIRSI